MARRPTRGPAAAALAVGVALVAAACTSAPAPSKAQSTVTVDTVFTSTTLDPARTYDPTGSMVDHGLYETLLAFSVDDVSRVVPGLATLDESQNATRFTLRLRGPHRFSDGEAMTADDVVFSLDRVIRLKGAPSFLLAGVTVSKRNATTVVLTTAKPSPGLPAVLANPATGILNSTVVKAQGPSAGRYLDTHSAGSGPYVLKSSSARQIVLTPNPDHDGTPPSNSRVVVRNVAASAQAADLRRRDADADVALDLTAAQASALKTSARVTATPSTTVVFLLLGQDPTVSPVTADPSFVKAVKEGIDYGALTSAAGRGASRAIGVMPSQLLGALGPADALVRDTAQARVDLSASGYAGQQITLDVPSDVTVGGVSLATLADRIASQLGQIGIRVTVSASPESTKLDDYRNGLEQMGLWYRGLDSPDPSTALVFAPGGTVGVRAGWRAGADGTLTALASRASGAGSSADRASRFVAFQRALNASGPFVPLIQPAAVIAARPRVTGVSYNPVWTLDLASLARR